MNMQIGSSNNENLGRPMTTTLAHFQNDPPVSRQMEGMLAGHFVAECLHVVAVLGIADLLAKAPKSIKAIASATGCHQLSLYRLMRTLASVGVFTESMPGQFQLTALARPCVATLLAPCATKLSSKFQHLFGWLGAHFSMLFAAAPHLFPKYTAPRYMSTLPSTPNWAPYSIVS